MIEKLHRLDEAMPVDLERDLLALGEAAVQPLIDVLLGELGEDSGGESWAPMHAVTVLAALKPAAAIEPMLDVLLHCEPDDFLYSKLVSALGEFGSPAVEPTLARWAEASPEARGGLADLLIETKVKDPRILALLLELLQEDPELGAMELAGYADEAALPALSAAFDATEVVAGGPLRNRLIIELAAAIEALGRPLSDAQAAKRAAVLASAGRVNRGDDGVEASQREIQNQERQRFGAWLSDSDSRETSLGWVDLLFRSAWDFEGVAPEGIDVDTLRAVLLEHFPRKVSVEASAASEIVVAMKAWFTFADRELRHRHAGDCLEVLTPQLTAAVERELGDPGNFGMAKSMVMSGKERGFAVETKEGMARWMTALNGQAGGEAVRRDADREAKKRQKKAKKKAQRRNRR